MVRTNDPEYPELQLAISTKILVPLWIKPSRLTFPEVDRSADSIKGTVTLERGDGGPIKPEVIQRSRATAMDTTMREIEPGERYELDVKLTPPYPNGRLMDSLRLRTGVEEAPTTHFYVHADFPPRVRVVPRKFTLPQMIKEPFEQSVKLEWVGTTPHKVLRAEANVPELTARVEEQDGRQSVVLHAPTGYKRAAGTFPRVIVHTDDAELPTIAVQINFSGRTGRRGMGVRSLTPQAVERSRPSQPARP